MKRIGKNLKSKINGQSIASSARSFDTTGAPSVALSSIDPAPPCVCDAVARPIKLINLITPQIPVTFDRQPHHHYLHDEAVKRM